MHTPAYRKSVRHVRHKDIYFKVVEKAFALSRQNECPSSSGLFYLCLNIQLSWYNKIQSPVYTRIIV